MIIRASNITERSPIHPVHPDSNPQGFTVEKFEIIENRDLRVLERQVEHGREIIRKNQ